MIAASSPELIVAQTDSPATSLLANEGAVDQQAQSQQQPATAPPHQHAHANNVGDYTIADVYEDAAVIGSELERIISNYGSHVLKELMPKVIGVLELLEQLTLRKEREAEQLNECRLKINSLEMEKMQRFNEREKFEKELEEIEEKWKQETLKLIGMVNKLKEENKRLNDTINKNNFIMKQNDQITIKQEELDYIRQIKEENIKLKETIRFKDREIEQKNEENEGLQSQIERLTSTMLNLRRKQILAQNQIEKMVKSKAELECSLTEKDHQLNLLRKSLHMRSLNDDEDEATAAAAAAATATASRTRSSTSESSTSGGDKSTSKELSNMLVFDAKDPNRPRFTLKELQKVLMEKNELTIKLDQTQDELEQLRKQEAMHAGDVQGPINREPEEKLDPSLKNQPASSSSTSGIRRFFGFFLSTTSTSNERSSMAASLSGNLQADAESPATATTNSPATTTTGANTTPKSYRNDGSVQIDEK